MLRVQTRESGVVIASRCTDMAGAALTEIRRCPTTSDIEASIGLSVPGATGTPEIFDASHVAADQIHFWIQRVRSGSL